MPYSSGIPRLKTPKQVRIEAVPRGEVGLAEFALILTVLNMPYSPEISNPKTQNRCALKLFREEKLVFATEMFVAEKMGKANPRPLALSREYGT